MSHIVRFTCAVRFRFWCGLAILLATNPLCSAEDGARKADRYSQWKQSGTLYILTTPDGAHLPEGAVVEAFPLLVRLHRDSFDFSQCAAEGADLRFSTEAGEPLPYQIDHWDPDLGVAGVWVRIPRIEGNSRQSFRIHWGNGDAKSESDGAAVFNEKNGYASVWHLNAEARDEVGTLTSVDTGTTPARGVVGPARRFPGQKGIFGGEMIPDYPSGGSAHSSEAWFRCERPNSTILGWGNEGGGRGSKVRMQFRSPPHVHIDSDFSDVKANSRLPLGEWIHVAHTYANGVGKIYINGQLDGEATPTLAIKSPARCWLGGWYHNYDFVGDLDEVRISRVARSADWIKLEFENQKPLQTLVGPVVRGEFAFTVAETHLDLQEGTSATVSARADGAQKVYWILKKGKNEAAVAVDRFSYTIEAGRVTGDEHWILRMKAIHGGGVTVQDVNIRVRESISDPEYKLVAPATWDGRTPIEVVPEILNRKQLEAAGAAELRYTWNVENLAVIQQVAADRLRLSRAQQSGPCKVTVAIDNGGAKVVRSITIEVTEPKTDPWVPRVVTTDERPEENQFFPRDASNTGVLIYKGTLDEPADSVFVRVYANDKIYKSQRDAVQADKAYELAVRLQPGLVKYRTEFGTKSGDRETILHTAANLVCGDAYLIDGQSNADATDVGPEDPTITSDWIRSFGSMAGDAQGARLRRWGNAVVRDRNGGKLQIGYWGMELAQRLVKSQEMPICILNGAVGGSRIDQHQRNPDDPTDVTTIYGRLLWRVREAKLTHGIRGVLWHQGENDQGADGPTGGFGWETYRQYFIDMAAGWKTDYPNIQHYYVFQIWPKACSMGVNGSDNHLREVQRNLPLSFSRLSVMSTLGIKPPGGCHFPVEGYAEFARLIAPLVERDIHGVVSKQPVTAPNLLRARYTNDTRDALVLEFDQPVGWSPQLTSEFLLDGERNQVSGGTTDGSRLLLKLKQPSRASRVTYLDSAAWNPGNLLYGQNGIAALTFCDVPIEPTPSAR